MPADCTFFITNPGGGGGYGRAPMRRQPINDAGAQMLASIMAPQQQSDPNATLALMLQMAAQQQGTQQRMAEFDFQKSQAREMFDWQKAESAKNRNTEQSRWERGQGLSEDMFDLRKKLETQGLDVQTMLASLQKKGQETEAQRYDQGRADVEKNYWTGKAKENLGHELAEGENKITSEHTEGLKRQDIDETRAIVKALLPVSTTLSSLPPGGTSQTKKQSDAAFKTLDSALRQIQRGFTKVQKGSPVSRQTYAEQAQPFLAQIKNYIDTTEFDQTPFVRDLVDTVSLGLSGPFKRRWIRGMDSEEANDPVAYAWKKQMQDRLQGLDHMFQTLVDPAAAQVQELDRSHELGELLTEHHGKIRGRNEAVWDLEADPDATPQDFVDLMTGDTSGQQTSGMEGDLSAAMQRATTQPAAEWSAAMQRATTQPAAEWDDGTMFEPELDLLMGR